MWQYKCNAFIFISRSVPQPMKINGEDVAVEVKLVNFFIASFVTNVLAIQGIFMCINLITLKEKGLFERNRCHTG